MIYVASPYTHPDPAVREYRYRQAMSYVHMQTMQGVARIFSPIQYTHEMAHIHAMPKEFEFWQQWCLRWLDIAEELHVIKLTGWEESAGIRAEIQHARRLGLPISEVTWGQA